jgi:isoleucyl-tRNA synthetase
MFNLPAREQEIIKFWSENNIFEKSLTKESPRGDYVFYDGPPFATGTPHYGHIVASIMKDVVPRYQTMQGYHVERKWGWDCHGLPIENIVEEELGIESKKDIEEKVGVDVFNETCRSKVMVYADVWKTVMARLGRWADMENDYKTMDKDFMESVWWVFRQLWDKDLIYKDYKSMHVCPRCETTLSQSEVTEGYKDVKDISVTTKFELADERGVFVLAWTTTPWTLPGNVALAVGEDITYIEVISDNQKYILAKELVEKVFADKEYQISREFKGSELVGKKYQPLFDYFKEQDLKNKENLYVITDADFVTTEDGTGVVHIAPAFGEDDMNLGREKKLSFIQHVGLDGRLTVDVTDFAGLEVKPKEDPQSTDIKVLKYLAEKGLLFSKEKYEHSYPHCWRCDSPLLNYATSSWFVKVTAIKEKALEQAKNINWTPNHIKEGRFGNWLEGARDWSISRQRYWGSVMPIWVCDQCGEQKVFGSVSELEEISGQKIDDLHKHTVDKITFQCDKCSDSESGESDFKNTYYLVRHGESENNVLGINISDLKNDKYNLTEKGRNQVEVSAEKIKEDGIDLIFSSPFLRTKQTAGIIADQLKLDIKINEDIREVECGELEGKEYQDVEDYFDTPLPGGESLQEVEKRMIFFIKKLEKEFVDKKIVIVSHGDPLATLKSYFTGHDLKEVLKKEYPQNGEYYKSGDFTSGGNGIMKRIPDVLDCWFESGSMPYAQVHYPFENKEKFEKNFPAKFIAEGADQTRAWFYYLHILGVALEEKNVFENVIVNGIVLAEDGKKMSKRLKNYPDPMEVMDKYGSDALRYYLTSSQVMKAENFSFSEKDLTDQSRFFNTLFNVLSFYQMFAEKDRLIKELSTIDLSNVLDKWIISKLQSLNKKMTARMEGYDLHAIREIPAFVDELSTWYVRRSRDRVKKGDTAEKEQVLNILYYVLFTLSKLMAPFMPFVSEHIYRELSGNRESVHLEDWPAVATEFIDETIILHMEVVRKIVEVGLSERAEQGFKVRQPLQKITVSNSEVPTEYTELIKDEVNIKEVVFAKDDSGEIKVELDTELTEELKNEGLLREMVRTINQLRKQKGLTVADRIVIKYDSANLKEIFAKIGASLKEQTLTDEILEGAVENEVKINGQLEKIEIEKK